MTEKINARAAWNGLLASIVVFLVALPLCMGIACASVFLQKSGTVELCPELLGASSWGCSPAVLLRHRPRPLRLSVLVYDLGQSHGSEKSN